MLGYTPVEPAAVLATHLQEIVRRHADELLNRDAAKHLIDELKKQSPAAVDELIPGVLKLAEVQQVLQMLSLGLANKEIAARLRISDHTVKFHVASILGKLGVRDRLQAVVLAYQAETA